MVRARNHTSAPMHCIDASWEVTPLMHQREGVVTVKPERNPLSHFINRIYHGRKEK